MHSGSLVTVHSSEQLEAAEPAFSPPEVSDAEAAAQAAFYSPSPIDAAHLQDVEMHPEAPEAMTDSRLD